jgi:hypothetical protein
MKLSRLRVAFPEALGQLDLSFRDDEGHVRPITLIYGGPGAGKTLLLQAIASTRPGHSVAMGRPTEPRCSARCEWLTGMDQPDRTTPVALASPAPSELALVDTDQRRDASFVDRLAKSGGFVFLCFSALRWFSKTPLALTSPARTIARYDVREYRPLDDAARNDLVREVKQALSYAAITRALPQPDGEKHHLLGEAMLGVVQALATLYGFDYLEIDPRSLEPVFRGPDGTHMHFDAIPTAVKHAVAFGALPLAALWAAYPGMDPRRAEGLVAIDQLELQQDPQVASSILDALTAHMPALQLVVTTRSLELLAARESDEALALRRVSPQGQVSIDEGPNARVH